MTDTSSSVRMTACQTRIYLYVSLTLIAALVVLVPLLTTALRRLQDAWRPAALNPSACLRSGNGRTIPIFFSASDTGWQIFNSLVIAALTVFLTVDRLVDGRLHLCTCQVLRLIRSC